MCSLPKSSDSIADLNAKHVDQYPQFRSDWRTMNKGNKFHQIS